MTWEEKQLAAYHDGDSSTAGLPEGQKVVVGHTIVLDRVLVDRHVVGDEQAVVLLLLLSLPVDLSGEKHSQSI